MANVFIYALREPDTGEIRYIGQTKRLPSNRLGEHVSRARKKSERCHRISWIQSLIARGLKPVLEILDQVPEDLGGSAEMGYIYFYRGRECNLVNGTPGGEGGPGMTGKHLTPEHQAKLIAANTGRKWTPEQIERQRIRATGVKPSKESKEKNRLAHLGMHAGVLNPMFGIHLKHSAETKEEIRISSTGRKHTLVSLEKMRRVQKALRVKRKLDYSIQNCMVSV